MRIVLIYSELVIFWTNLAIGQIYMLESRMLFFKFFWQYAELLLEECREI